MEGFTIIDGIVAAVIVISAILAYSRGFVREVMSIAGWIIAAIIAFLFAPAASPLISEIPVVGDFVGGSCELAIILAFAGVFAIALVIVSLFTPLLSSAVQRSAIGGLDAGLGFFFGVLRGVLLVVVALVAYDRVAGSEPIAMVADSRTAMIFGNAQSSIDEQVPEDAPGWVLQRYEQLIGTCDIAGDTPPAETPSTDG